MENKYEFNPERCKAAIEGLSKMVHDNGYTAIPTRDKVLLGVILEDLILDIEALHTAAQERDDLVRSIHDLSPTEIGYTDYVELSEVEALTDHLWERDENMKYHLKVIADLVL